MGDRTAIEWSDATWNPLVGCTKVGSPGCEHCYAIDVVHRGMSNQHKGLTIKRDGERPDWNGQVREVRHLLSQPRRWQRPRRIFVNSLSDLFHADVSDGFIAEVFAVMADCERHTFQVLTKRPQRMASLLASPDFWFMVNHHREPVLQPVPRWLPNVWLGTSIENDRYTWRADHLRRLHPAARKFLSLEPLLGPLPSLDLTGIGWVIVGGESGRDARPMHPDWARDLRDRCAAAPCPKCHGGAVDPWGNRCAGCMSIVTGESSGRGIPFLFKQWGEWAPGLADVPRVMPFNVDGTDDPRAESETMSRVGKKNAGRMLDGRVWSEFPR